ncbi:hypothetical protein ACXKTX_11235 [Burkholderia gladioli]
MTNTTWIATAVAALAATPYVHAAGTAAAETASAGASASVTPTSSSTAAAPVATPTALPPVDVHGTAPPSYAAEASATTTRTDTPLKDYPGSVQVVPAEVLQDRGVRDPHRPDRRQHKRRARRGQLRQQRRHILQHSRL